MAEAPIDATLSQPTASPDPVAIETIRQGNPETEQAVVFPCPAFSHGARRDRRGGVHKNHHKEKQHQDGRIADGTG